MTHIFKHFSLAIALMIGTAYAMDIAPQEIHSNPPTQLAEDGLPEDVNERNEFLSKNQYLFERYTKSSSSLNTKLLESFTPYPNNPFRSPGMILPKSEIEKKDIIKFLEDSKSYALYLKSEILYDMDTNEVTEYTNKDMTKETEKSYNIMNEWANHILDNTDTMHSLAKQGKFPADYYLPRARKNAHDLIGASKFQKDSYHNQEVIVLDVGHAASTHLNYTNKENPLDLQIPPKVEHHVVKRGNHSTSVSGVVGARNAAITDRTTLDIENHFKGVLTALIKTKARVINMSAQMPIYMPCLLSDRSQLSPDKQAACRSLDQFFNIIKERDIILVQAAGNEGLMLEKIDPQTGKPETDLKLGIPGLQYLQQSDPYFKNYRKNWVDLTDVAHTIPQIKDRVIFVGNLMANGIVPAQTSSLPGAFASDFIFAPSDGIYTLKPMTMDKSFTDKKKEIAKIHISRALATLKVSLPELPQEAAIQSLLALINPKWVKELTQEFGAFGGTSGAAPRVSGALIILHQKFPDLPMTTIRKCLLESGYPFWKELPKKLFAWGRRVSMNPDESLTDYGKMLFGHGRVDVEAAYHACLAEQDKLRAKPWTGNKKK